MYSNPLAQYATEHLLDTTYHSKGVAQELDSHV